MNCTKIIMYDEYLLLYDDKIAISWFRNDINEVDFKTAPRIFKFDLISRVLALFMYSFFIYLGIKQDNKVMFYIFIPLIIATLIYILYRLLYFSSATEIQKDKIKKISVNKRRLSILYDSGKKERKREIKLPTDETEKETALQLLRGNDLIN